MNKAHNTLRQEFFDGIREEIRGQTWRLDRDVPRVLFGWDGREWYRVTRMRVTRRGCEEGRDARGTWRPLLADLLSDTGRAPTYRVNGVRRGSPRAVCYVTAYTVTRHYGGPEEGGWWYDWYEFLRSERTINRVSEHVFAKMSRRTRGAKYGNIASVRGGQDVRIFVEDYPGQHTTKEVPHYE